MVQGLVQLKQLSLAPFPHEPADLINVPCLTRGNISSHASKLEAAGYLDVIKEFRGRTPVTSYSITAAGREALNGYREQLRAVMQPQTEAQGGLS